MRNLKLGAWPSAVVATAAVAGLFGNLLGPFDFLTFFHAGQAVIHGRTPYVPATSPVFQSGHAFVYPLFVAWLFAPLAVLPQSAAEAAYLAGSVAAIGASCRLLGRRDWKSTVLVLLSATTITGLQMGTVNAFLLFGVACAWRWRRDHPVLAGVVLGAAAAAKLFLLPLLVWPLFRRRYSTFVASAAAVVLLGGSTVFFGAVPPRGYMHLLSQLQAHEQVGSWSLSAVLNQAGLSPSTASAAAVMVAVIGLAVLWRYRSRLSDGRLLGSAVVCALLMSPIVWSSYLLLLVVPILLATRTDVVLAVEAAASWLVVTPDAASPLRIAVGASLAVIAAALVARPLARHYRRLKQSPIAAQLAGTGVAAACAALLLPPSVRSPLPALAAMGVAGYGCVRPGRRPRLGLQETADRPA